MASTKKKRNKAITQIRLNVFLKSLKKDLGKRTNAEVVYSAVCLLYKIIDEAKRGRMHITVSESHKSPEFFGVMVIPSKYKR